jgi:hypothetical protein
MIVIALLLLTSMGQAQATLIADVRGDFVAGTNDGDPGILPATGTGTWNYLASDTTNPTLDTTLDVLPWVVLNKSYIDFTTGGSANQIDLQSANLAADEIRMHPSASGRPPSYVVARWIAGAGEAGFINITGNVRKVDAGGGSGVTFDLFVDGTSYFNWTLPYNDTLGVAFDQTVIVGVGSTVDFVVGPNGFDTYDSTALKAAISPVPEPATMLLFGSGLMGLAGLRRKFRKK